MIIHFFLCVSLFSQYDSTKNSSIENFCYFNEMVMSKRLLPGYNLSKEKVKYLFGKLYVYSNIDTTNLIYITIGLHTSREKASNLALQYISSISIAMEEVSNLGDKAWLYKVGETTTNILFVRNNAFIEIISHGNPNLMTIAQKIDNDLLNNEDYIYLTKDKDYIEIDTIAYLKAIDDGDQKLIYKIETRANLESDVEYYIFPKIAKQNPEDKSEFIYYSSQNDHFDTIQFYLIKDNYVSDSKIINLKNLNPEE